MDATKSSRLPGLLSGDSLYTLDEAQQRLRLGKQAWRTARLEGLPVRAVGRRRYVLGQDVMKWIATKPVDLAAGEGVFSVN